MSRQFGVPQRPDEEAEFRDTVAIAFLCVMASGFVTLFGCLFYLSTLLIEPEQVAQAIPQQGNFQLQR